VRGTPPAARHACPAQAGPRPAWWALYLIGGVGLGALGAADMLLAGEPTARTLAEAVGALGVFAGLGGWVAANRGALAGEGRCCTAQTRWRVVAGQSTAEQVAIPLEDDEAVPTARALLHR
jgi:hypothetical protein